MTQARWKVLGGRVNNASGMNTIFCTQRAPFDCVAFGFLSNSVWTLYYLFLSHVKLGVVLKFEQASTNLHFLCVWVLELVGNVLILVC